MGILIGPLLVWWLLGWPAGVAALVAMAVGYRAGYIDRDMGRGVAH